MKEDGRQTFWQSLGYSGPCNADGFPVPGKLVCEHRKRNNLTQADLARLLCVKRPTVTRMENEGLGLDSMKTRRQILAILPTIPALALGLSDLDLQKTQPLYDTSLLQRLLHYHREAYFHGDAGTLQEVEKTISTIYDLSKHTNYTDRAVLEILCSYVQLGLDISREKRMYRAAKRFAENAYQLSCVLKDDTFKAATLLRYSAVLFEQGKVDLAASKIDEAFSLKKLPGFLRGAITIEAIRPYALLDPKKSLVYAKNALAFADLPSEGDREQHYVRLSLPFAQMRQAFVYTQIGAPEEALDVLEEAQSENTFPRRQIGMQILQSTALLQQKEYEASANIAIEALSSAQKINSLPNIALITQLYHRLDHVTSNEVTILGKLLATPPTVS